MMRNTIFNQMAILLASSMLLLLTACAAGQSEFREGTSLIEKGQVELGLSKIQQAMDADPASGEYRRAYFLAREQATRSDTDKADLLRQQGKLEQARLLYEKVLVIDARNSRARLGMKALQQMAFSASKIKDARAALASQDWTAAKDALSMLLADDPANEEALALSREVAVLSAVKQPETQLSVAYKKPISIEFKEVALKQAFEVLSKTSGLNFVFDKDVKSDTRVSIFLRDSTVESALYFLLLTNQLEQQVMNGNTLLIYPNNANKAKDYQELTVRAFQMVNTDVKSVAAALKTLFKGRDVVVDEKLNMLVVRDTPEAIKLVEKIVALHDVPEPEVMLDVEVLEVSRSKLLELGVQWPTSATFTPLNQRGGTGLTITDLRNLTESTTQVGSISATVNARQQDTFTNTLANPRIRVINREKAKILIGDKVPIFTTTTTATSSSDSVSYVDVGLKLDVEPTIYRGNDIVIKLGLEVSSLGEEKQSKGAGGAVATANVIGTRNANTVLRLKDGENQILAGLINDDDRRTANKLPGLGELPVAGRLFGSSKNEGGRSEIILSITPHLVRNIQRPEQGIQEFKSGTENSLRERPASSSPASSTPIQKGAGGIGGLSGASVAEANEGQPKVSMSTDMPPSIAPALARVPAAINDALKATEPAVIVLAGKSTETRSDEGDGSEEGELADEDAADASPISVALSGPDTVKTGQEFTMVVSGSTSNILKSMPVTVGFDASALEVVRVEAGNWFSGGRGTFRSDQSARGRVVMYSPVSPAGVRGGGDIARITFRATGSHTTANVWVQSALPIGRKGALGKIVLPAPQRITMP